MFSCEDVRSALAGYLDDEVSADLRREVEQHLAACRTCQVLYDTTRKTLRIVTNAGSFDVPEAASAQLVERIMKRLALSAPGATPQS